jgi:hypothetical protein
VCWLSCRDCAHTRSQYIKLNCKGKTVYHQIESDKGFSIFCVYVRH